MSTLQGLVLSALGVGKEEEYTSSEIGSGVFSLGRGIDALTVDDSCLEPVEEV